MRRAWEIQQEAEQLRGGRQDDQGDEGDFMNQHERDHAPLHAEDDRTPEQIRRDDEAQRQWAHFHPQNQEDEEWHEDLEVEQWDPDADLQVLEEAFGWD